MAFFAVQPLVYLVAWIQIIKIKADSPLTRLSALNSSRHIQFHYYLISSEPCNFLSYYNFYGFRHLRTEYSCCLHIQAS